jgi:hypothetical protein
LLPAVPGWSRRAAGDGVVLEAGGVQVRYTDDLAPIVRFATIAGAGARGDRFVTREGEHGVVAAVDAGAVAVVLGDYHYARLDAVGRAADLVDVVRELARHVSFGLGVRRRRVWHRPPPGWLGVPRGLASVWIGPQPPRGAARIRVFPATPARLEPDEVLAAILDERGRDDAVVERVARPHGLIARTASGPARCDWALERVGGYHYTVRLDCADAGAHESARPAFDALVDSLERVPAAGAETADALGHWSE